MKRVVAFLLILAFVSFSSLAEIDVSELDISSLETEDLLLLQEKVEEELTVRGENERAVLLGGPYVVGENISEGIYIITFTPDEDAFMAWFTCNLYNSIEQYENKVSSDMLSASDNEEEEKFRVNLEKGMVLNITDINDGTCTIEKDSGEPII